MPEKRFADPPINEVVCGVFFEPAEVLDPVLVGRFWETQLQAFPKKQLLPAITAVPAEGLVIELSPVPPLRTWLVSADDSRVMQIQADRFYLNWRGRGAAYPSFNKLGEEVGLLVEVLEAYGKFSTFMKERAGHALQPTIIELSMIDVFKQGRHWGDLRDLERLVPSLLPFSSGLDSLPTILSAHIEGPTPEFERRVVIQRATLRDSGADAVRLETTARRKLAGPGDLEAAFKGAHTFLKRTFDELIPKSEHHRFESPSWKPTP